MEPEHPPERFTWWHGLLLTEGTALVLGLVLTVTPSRTGSDASIADRLYPDPTFLQELLVHEIAAHALIYAIAAGLVVWWRRQPEVGE